jgi:hypothetical protein
LKIPVDTSFFSVTADWESRKLTKITMTENERKSLKRAINDPDLLVGRFLLCLQFVTIESKDICDVECRGLPALPVTNRGFPMKDPVQHGKNRAWAPHKVGRVFSFPNTPSSDAIRLFSKSIGKPRVKF